MQDFFLNSTVASKVIEHLREDIVLGKLSEGERITIKEIAEAYNVSPMPVREAFRALEGEKLLEIVPYKGAIVRKIDERFALEVLEMCDALGAYMTEKAMGQMGEEDIAHLEEINNQIRELRNTPEDLSRHVKLNTEFHTAIYNWSYNETARTQHSYYHMLASMIRGRYRHSYERIQQIAVEHDAIIEAIRKNDKISLKMAVDRHETNSRSSLMAQYRGQNQHTPE